MTGRQNDAFRRGEGDAYFERNQLSGNPTPTWVEETLADYAPFGGSVLEVGCSDGRRLEALRSLRPDLVTLSGVDPSVAAIDSGQESWPHLDIHVSTADDLTCVTGGYDIVFFGFCLYLCDRDDLFTIAAAAHTKVKIGGIIAILDFDPPSPAKRQYAHLNGLWSYKMDYSQLWACNPEYTEVNRVREWASTEPGRRSAFDRIALTVLRRHPDPYRLLDS